MISGRYGHALTAKGHGHECFILHTPACMTWVNKEFADISFGDKRLDRRFLNTVEIFSQHPRATINRAIEDSADKKAAYRLFSNNSCTASKILSVHQARTRQRMKNHQVVLSIHDTTYLNYNNHDATDGLGSIGGPSDDPPAQGLICHAGMALTETGVPLGIQSLKIWARPENGIGARSIDCPAVEKESYRWIEGMKEAQKLYSEKTQMIFISDREGDMFDLFLEAQKLGVDVVIRSKHDRLIIGNDYYLSWHLAKLCDGEYVTVEDHKNNRKANVKITYAKIAFNSPIERKSKHLLRNDINKVEVYVVEAKEENPPDGKNPLHWRLLTTIPVKSTESAKKIINYYRKRWHIESFFKVFKKGCCDVESCCLQSADKLMKYLTVFSIIAWRLYWMVHINRHRPDANCTEALTENEWKTLYCRTYKTKIIPTGPPMSMREAIRLIAKMGGFNGRKGDKEPGMITLWRGWIRLQDMVEMFEVLS